MGLTSDLESDVKEVFAMRWETRVGEVVPEAEHLRLGNDAVTFEEAAILLYAHLAESTALVNAKKNHFAAEVYKTYLHCAANIIRKNDGVITAFDGDRIWPCSLAILSVPMP